MLDSSRNLQTRGKDKHGQGKMDGKIRKCTELGAADVDGIQVHRKRREKERGGSGEKISEV